MDNLNHHHKFTTPTTTPTLTTLTTLTTPTLVPPEPTLFPTHGSALY